LLPGAKDLVNFLEKNNKKYLFLTNNSAPTPRELQQKLQRLGIDVTEDHFFTSGQATAYFLHSQMPEVSFFLRLCCNMLLSYNITLGWNLLCHW
jgi:NagD protein